MVAGAGGSSVAFTLVRNWNLESHNRKPASSNRREWWMQVESKTASQRAESWTLSNAGIAPLNQSDSVNPESILRRHSSFFRNSDSQGSAVKDQGVGIV